MINGMKMQKAMRNHCIKDPKGILMTCGPLMAPSWVKCYGGKIVRRSDLRGGTTQKEAIKRDSKMDKTNII